MPTTATDTIERLAQREYKFGFSTDIEQDTVPPGLDEDVIRLISAKKEEPEFMLEWRLKAYRHWLEMTEPHWPNVHYDPIDYQSIVYYSAPKSMKDGPKSLAEVDPELLKTYEKLGIPLREQEMLAGVAVDAVFDSVSVATTFRDQAGRGRDHLLLVLRGGARAPRAGQEVPRHGGAAQRQLLRGAQLRGVLGRLLRLHPQGRALPDGALDLLPHQRHEHRAVRAHADHRRRGRLRELPRRLHRAQARREPAPRRGGRADRARERHHQVLDGAELVPRRQGRHAAASSTS